MSNIIEKIKKIDKLYHAEGCSVEQLKQAQDELSMYFPEEYKDIVKEYGAISFYGTEWTGLNVDDYLDVVKVTKEERNINKSFPEKYFVLENQGIDGLMIICNECGQVFSLRYNQIIKIHDTISSYLDECINRK